MKLGMEPMTRYKNKLADVRNLYRTKLRTNWDERNSLQIAQSRQSFLRDYHHSTTITDDVSDNFVI